MRIRLLVLPLLLASAPAWALKPNKHRQLAEASCEANHLPQPFCDRMGKQAYETDHLEWTDLSAHAQRELGQDRCEAAEAAATRVEMLGRAIVDHANAARYEEAAIDLGRAIHTLQDECAHHGMTNQEHAFYSLEQVCTSEDTSPDVQPDALACAESRTRQAFALVAPALANTRWDAVDWICRDSEDRDTCTSASLPGPWTACSFRAEHKDWDGVDSRWNADRVGSALMSAFAAGLAGDLSPRSVCGGDASAIDPTAPHPTVTDRNAGCGLIDITCLGKVDEDSGAAMSESGGCAAGHSGGAAGALLVSLIAAGLLRRRSAQ